MRIIYLLEVFQGGIHGLEVHLHDLVAFVRIGFHNGILDLFNGFVFGQNSRNGKEAGLQNGVGPFAQIGFLGHLGSVDHVEFQLVLHDFFLDLHGQFIPHLCSRERRVQQKSASFLNVPEDVELFDKVELVAGDKISLVDQVGRTDGLGPEAQVRNSLYPGLLGVVDEIPLYVVVGGFAYDLDGVLVGPYRTVRAEAVEHAVEGAFGGLQPLADLEAGMGHIVVDAHGEVILRMFFVQFVINGFHHGRIEFLAGETIAAADDFRHAAIAFVKGGNHVEVKGLAHAAGLFGPVQNGNLANGFRDGIHEVRHRERTEQPHDDRADFLAPFDQGVYGFDHRPLA